MDEKKSASQLQLENRETNTNFKEFVKLKYEKGQRFDTSNNFYNDKANLDQSVEKINTHIRKLAKNYADASHISMGHHNSFDDQIQPKQNVIKEPSS